MKTERSFTTRVALALNRFFERYGWAMWLILLGWNLWPPASRPPFVAFGGLMLGIHLHRRFGTSLIGSKGERVEWRR